MGTIQASIVMVLTLFTMSPARTVHKPPAGFQFIPAWTVFANSESILWHAGDQWKVQDGTWRKREAARWVLDEHPPAVIAQIPKEQASCPPGLVKPGCPAPAPQGAERGSGLSGEKR